MQCIMNDSNPCIHTVIVCCSSSCCKKLKKMGMAKMTLEVLLLAMAVLLCFGACQEAGTGSPNSSGSSRGGNETEAPRTWCIANPSSDNLHLEGNIDFCCKQDAVDCRPISPAGSCFNPDNPASHASFAMNLYYNAMGKHSWNCFFNGTGLVVYSDPSTDACVYPG